MIYIYNGILLILKKNEIIPFASIWMDLVGIMLKQNKSDREQPIPYESKK